MRRQRKCDASSGRFFRPMARSTSTVVPESRHARLLRCSKGASNGPSAAETVSNAAAEAQQWPRRLLLHAAPATTPTQAAAASSPASSGTSGTHPCQQQLLQFCHHTAAGAQGGPVRSRQCRMHISPACSADGSIWHHNLAPVLLVREFIGSRHVREGCQVRCYSSGCPAGGRSFGRRNSFPCGALKSGRGRRARCPATATNGKFMLLNAGRKCWCVRPHSLVFSARQALTEFGKV